MPDREDYSLRPLWGGAAHSELPSSFLDVSDVRQVPDHQECWMDGSGGDGPPASAGGADSSAAATTTASRERLLVFEILERRDSVEDDDAARFYFQDLAETNGDRSPSPATFVDVQSSALPSPRAGAVPSCSLVLGVGMQRVRMGRDYDFRGQPTTGQEVRHVRVEIAVLRLPAQHTDVLITLSTPIGVPIDGNAATPTPDLSQPFQRAVSSFEILDWSLFGSTTQ